MDLYSAIVGAASSGFVGLFAWLGTRSRTEQVQTETEAQKLGKVVDALREELANAGKRWERAEESWKTRLADADAKNEKLDRRIAGQAGEIDRLRIEVTNLQRSNNATELQYNNLREEFTELQQVAEQLRDDVAAHVEHVEALSKQVKALGQTPEPPPRAVKPTPKKGRAR